MKPLILLAATLASAASLGRQAFILDDVQDDVQKPGQRPGQQPAADTVNDVLYALRTMQETYFDLNVATWPEAIDWTAAVIGTHVSATLSTIVSSAPETGDGSQSPSELLSTHNTINKYFTHALVFYFGENAFGLRNQAYDDMLWVVLGWLERIKFTEMFTRKNWQVSAGGGGGPWYGVEVNPLAAHRARIFYELASNSWDESLCGGGCIWNPYLTPYKNAITNELFISASIAMYLYWPGDDIDSPFLSTSAFDRPHRPEHLDNAIKAYKWLQESGMLNARSGLYGDGYHVRGWRQYPNGTTNPGTGKCDEFDEMVYTYNQGVILSASRGLWLATGTRSYLDDGHALISSVMRATGWPNTDHTWRGLGRRGVLEDYCDHLGQCSQDGQTFKGIFFLHLAEFCRRLEQDEEDFIEAHASGRGGGHDQRSTYQDHLDRCQAYAKWVAHNAAAALATRNNDGLFGMWWTRHADGHLDEQTIEMIRQTTSLPTGAFDYRNPAVHAAAPDALSSRGGDANDRGRGRTVETQTGGLAVLRAHLQWQMYYDS